MTGSTEPLNGLDSIPWETLECAYGEGWRVPAILRRLAADAPEDVEHGWEEINEQILWHQGTVYPATAAAVPFIVRIAALPKVHRRPRLISYLAQLSLGGDPAGGISRAVREAVR